MLSRVINLSRQPVSGASLAAVRVAVGVVALVSVARLWANGWLVELYAGPTNHLRYPGFAWVPTPGVAGMVVILLVVAATAVGLVTGRCWRIAAALFTICFTWIELIDVSTYLNHYWFLTLLGGLITVGPFRHDVVARLWVWLARAQLAVVYGFAGLAKLHPDWLVDAIPLRLWLPARSEMPVFGPLLAHPEAAWVLSWAGALFDLAIIPALLWRRSRPWAWPVLVVFHVSTWLLFPIGVFPWLMIAASTVFFEPDWPERITRRLGRSAHFAGDSAPRRARVPSRAVTLAAAAWVALMVALPLRHHLIPGDARWTGEGYRFAWNVLLTERGGDVRFRVVDVATGSTWVTTGDDLLTPLQWRVMSSDAELVRQTAHMVAEDWRLRGYQVQVFADVFVALNGRPPQRLIDPAVDLAAEPWRPHQPWILDR
jgi:hypothetical protein